MTVTGTQIITRALKDLGCLRPGQGAGAAELADGLDALNERIDADLLNPLMLYAFRPDIFTMTAGVQVYKIGPGQVAPNFNSGRPTDIERANILLNTVSPIVRLPLHLADVDEWAAIRVRDIKFAIPLEMYFDRNFDPTGQFATLNFWPGPQSNYQLELFTTQQLQQFPDLITALNWPPGYVNYLRKNLAVDIAPQMELISKTSRLARPRQDLLQLVIKQAREAKAAVESYNAQHPVLALDPAYKGGRGSMWNYSIGEAVSRGT